MRRTVPVRRIHFARQVKGNEDVAGAGLVDVCTIREKRVQPSASATIAVRSGIGRLKRVRVIAHDEQKEPTLSNQVKLIKRHQNVMGGSLIGGGVVIGLFVLLLPNPFSGMNKTQAYFFYLGIVCLLLGFHSALRALTVEPTNVIYLQASSAWWSLTAFMG